MLLSNTCHAPVRYRGPSAPLVHVKDADCGNRLPFILSPSGYTRVEHGNLVVRLRVARRASCREMPFELPNWKQYPIKSSGGETVTKSIPVCACAIVAAICALLAFGETHRGATQGVFALIGQAPASGAQNPQGEHPTIKREECLQSEALIEHTGSTNTSGFHVCLSPDGTARYFVNAHRLQTEDKRPEFRNGKVKASLAKRFFADLKNAMPLSQFPAARCMKSASFGYELRARYQGQDSPDLACESSDKRLQALTADAKKIGEALFTITEPRKSEIQ